MKLGRFFLKGSKLPDLIILPLDMIGPKKGSNRIEKMLYFREKARGRSKVLVVSKKVLEKVGGFDKNLGFGEDRLFERKLFKVLKMSKDEIEKFRI